MKMAEFKEIVHLSKWLKVFFIVLSAVAVVGVITSFALMIWADDKVETANLTFNGVDMGDKSAKVNEIAYKARVYFPRLDFLLRSKVIAYIDIAQISWDAQINANSISSVKSQNRHIKFITSQNLQALNIQNLGEVKYKMDFSPLPKTIVKYYVGIVLVTYLALILCRIFNCSIGNTLEFLKHNSLPQALWQGYKSINPLYRHTFWIVFIALNLVFGFHTAQFLWGNHDWGALLSKNALFSSSYEGRYTLSIIGEFLQGEQMLPMLNNVLAFAGLAFAAVWLCMYLNIQRKLYMWVVVGFMLTLQPFTLSKMYYTYQITGIFFSVAIGILGFVLAKKAGEYSIVANFCVWGGGESHKFSFSREKLKPYALCFLSIFCIHWGIASFQSFIDTALILLCGGIITIIIDNQGDLKTSLYKSRFIIISVVLAAIFYKIIFDILKKSGKVIDFYNNQMTSLSDLPERILLAIKLGFGNLIKYDVAFMPLSMTILFAVFLMTFLVFVYKSKLKLSAKFSILILLCGMILASQTHIVLSQVITSDPRVQYYGLMFLRVLFVALAFICVGFVRAQKLAQNLLFILSFILIWICIVQDLYAQRVQKLAFDAELKLLNRVITRIEQSENFSYDKRYCGVMFGDAPNFRTKYYTINQHSELIGNMLLPIWDLKTPFDMFMNNNVFKDCYFLSSSFHYKEQKNGTREESLFLSLIKRLHKAGILDTLEPYPHKNSVVVFEDIIVFVASKGNLDEIRQMAKTLP